jgi:ribosomal protein S18 acetylase RimI-like enzyme
LVAEDEGRIIGFTAGAADTTQHFGAFYRHKLFQIVSIVGLRFFRDATVRRGMVKRLDHLRLALSSFVRRESQSSRIQEDGDHTLAQLLFIAVHPHYRRKGIAKRLIDDCLNEFKRNGTHRIGATVLPDNASSIAFFKKNSWVIEDTTPEFVYFQRDIA